MAATVGSPGRAILSASLGAGPRCGAVAGAAIATGGARSAEGCHRSGGSDVPARCLAWSACLPAVHEPGAHLTPFPLVTHPWFTGAVRVPLPPRADPLGTCSLACALRIGDDESVTAIGGPSDALCRFVCSLCERVAAACARRLPLLRGAVSDAGVPNPTRCRRLPARRCAA